MEHSGHSHSTGRLLRVAFLLNFAFTFLEIGGGIWTGSIAILTDALHDAGDSLSLGLAWYLQRLSQKDPDAKFTYGYLRFSNLGALTTGLVLLVGLCFVLWHAFGRLQQPADVYAPGMLAFAILGITMNGAAAWMLRGGHSHNEKVATWHLLEDTLGWAAVLVGSVVMTFWDLPIIDPLLAIFISLFILWNLFGNLKQVALVFLQSSPSSFDPKAFDRKIEQFPGVIETHHTHSWTLDGETHVFSTHLIMEQDSTREQIVAAKSRVQELLHNQQFDHITIEIELEGEACSSPEVH